MPVRLLHSIVSRLQPALLHKDQPGQHAGPDGNCGDDGEGVNLLLERQRDIHTVDAAYDVWNHHYNCETGQKFHDSVHVVGDDGSKGVHGSGQDITVDVGHADGLPVFGDRVLQQVRFILAELHAAHAQDLVHDDVVGLERSGEIHQTLLDAQKVDELLVAGRELETLLDDVGASVDVFQAVQIHERGALHEVDGEAHALRRIDDARAAVQKRRDQVAA